MPAKDSPKTAKRGCFATLVSWFFAAVVIAFCIALMWVTALHWHRDGQFSFRIFDLDWWRPGVVSAQQHADDAGQALWAPGGLIPRAKEWWESRSATGTGAATATGAVPVPATAASTTSATADTATPDVSGGEAKKRLENLIAGAETDFQLGLDEYRAANPANGAATVPQREHLRQAKAHFLLAQDALDRAIPAYADTPGHDTDRLDDATALRGYNLRLLHSLDKADTP